MKCTTTYISPPIPTSKIEIDDPVLQQLINELATAILRKAVVPDVASTLVIIESSNGFEERNKSLFRIGKALFLTDEYEAALTLAAKMDTTWQLSLFKEALQIYIQRLNDLSRQQWLNEMPQYYDHMIQAILSRLNHINVNISFFFCSKIIINHDQLLSRILSHCIQHSLAASFCANFYCIRNTQIRQSLLNELVESSSLDSFLQHIAILKERVLVVDLMEALIVNKKMAPLQKICGLLPCKPHKIREKLYHLINNVSTKYETLEAKELFDLFFEADWSDRIWKIYSQNRLEFLCGSAQDDELAHLAFMCIHHGDFDTACKIARTVTIEYKKEHIHLLLLNNEFPYLSDYRDAFQTLADCFAVLKISQERVFEFGDRYIRHHNDRHFFYSAYLRYDATVVKTTGKSN